METWKDVVGYEGLYQVSNLGNVKSVDHTKTVVQRNRTFQIVHKGKMLTPLVRKHGYLGVQLYGRGGHATRNLRTFSIHRLVAEAFIPNPNNYAEVNHIDEHKENNKVENLEWCNHIQNSNFGTRPSRIGEKHINGKKSKRIAQYTLDGIFVTEFPSMQEAGRNGFSPSSISLCCNGKQNQSGGYTWRYI